MWSAGAVKAQRKGVLKHNSDTAPDFYSGGVESPPRGDGDVEDADSYEYTRNLNSCYKRMDMRMPRMYADFKQPLRGDGYVDDADCRGCTRILNSRYEGMDTRMTRIAADVRGF